MHRLKNTFNPTKPLQLSAPRIPLKYLWAALIVSFAVGFSITETGRIINRSQEWLETGALLVLSADLSEVVLVLSLTLVPLSLFLALRPTGRRMRYAIVGIRFFALQQTLAMPESMLRVSLALTVLAFAAASIMAIAGGEFDLADRKRNKKFVRPSTEVTFCSFMGHCGESCKKTGKSVC